MEEEIKNEKEFHDSMANFAKHLERENRLRPLKPGEIVTTDPLTVVINS